MVSAANATAELTGYGAKPPRATAHLAENGHGQQSTGREPFDHRRIQTRFSETVTDEYVEGRPGGEAGVEVHHVEPAAVRHPAALRQVTGEADRHGGDVDAADREPPCRQPDGCPPPTAGDVERLSPGGEQALMGGEGRRRARRAVGNEPLAGVPPVPVQAIAVGHLPVC